MWEDRGSLQRGKKKLRKVDFSRPTVHYMYMKMYFPPPPEKILGAQTGLVILVPMLYNVEPFTMNTE